MENTGSDTSISVKNEVKLPREVKGNVWFISLCWTEGFNGRISEYVSVEMLEVGWASMLLLFRRAQTKLEILTYSDLAENSSHYFWSLVILPEASSAATFCNTPRNTDI